MRNISDQKKLDLAIKEIRANLEGIDAWDMSPHVKRLLILAFETILLIYETQ